MPKILLAALVVVSMASAGVVYRAPEVEEPAQWLGRDQGSLVRFDLPLLTAETKPEDGFGSATTFRIPGEGLMADLGRPDLPVVRRMVQVPETGGVEVEIVSQETHLLGIYDVAPYIGSPTRSGDRPDYRMDESVYGSPGPFPEQPVTLESVRILRDIRVAWLTYNPVRVDPVTGETWLTTSVTVRLVSAGEGENELRRRSSTLTRSFMPMYREVLGFDDSRDTGDGCYLVITTDEGYGYVESLVDWKREKGWPVVFGRVPDIGSTASAIDDYIEDAFNTWDVPPEYVLIVGDEDVVPTPYYSGNAADNQYGVIGSGCVPSIHVGRLCGGDTDALAYVAWKIEEYESNPHQPATSWFQNAISIGSTDFNDPEHSWEYAQIFMGAGMTVDYFCSEGGMSPTPTNVFNSIEEGKSLISFIGHGSMTSWSSPSCGDISDVQALSNGPMYPWINSIACYNGAFDDGYCFAEAWMGEGSTSDPKGAIGMMAATTASPVGQTDSLAEYTFRGYFEEDIWRMGNAVDYGKMMVEVFYGSGAVSNNNMHMIFGCPETDIFTETSPMPYVTAEHPDYIYEGSWTLTGYLGGTAQEGILVGLVQDDSLLARGFTGADGILTLDVPAVPSGEDVIVTCTYHNGYPYVGSATPGTGVGGGYAGTPATLSLAQPSPNPARGSTVIGYATGSAGTAELSVFDMSGRRVATLVSGEHAAGEHSMVWDGRDSGGTRVPDGVYMIRLDTGEGSLTRTCLMID